MGLYQYLREAWKKPKKTLSQANKERLMAFRREPVTVRIERPTRLDRARSLGYRAKQGIFVVRQRVLRGGRQREQFKSGRRSAHMRRKKIVGKNYQQVAEERVSKKYPNCEVLNSYKVVQDGKNAWYEVIMVDQFHPQILNDKKLKFITFQSGRAQRGLTSAGRKSRGLNKKGIGSEKTRPGRRANLRRG